MIEIPILGALASGTGTILEKSVLKIKKIDIKNMWDDYDLINCMGLSIGQIRELPHYKREDLLRKLSKN